VADGVAARLPAASASEAGWALAVTGALGSSRRAIVACSVSANEPYQASMAVAVPTSRIRSTRRRRWTAMRALRPEKRPVVR
jgi:hypothetical protein